MVLNRSMRVVVVVALAFGAGLLAAPGPASAASGVTTTGGWFAGNGFTSPLDADWRIGDCTLVKAMNPEYTYVRLSKPDDAGNATLYWRGIGRTRHTSNGDVWHLTLSFLFGNDNIVVTMPEMDGARMTVVGRYYHWEQTIDVVVDPVTYPMIRTVRWNSSC
jgi:hypothetical protein